MKNILIIAVAILSTLSATACDMCGGGAGSQYIGLLPGLSRNFVGIQFLSGNFSGRFPSPFQLIPHPDDITQDKYNTLQAWGRHKIGKHYQVFAFIPYQYNVRYINDEQVFTSGIGDITLLLNRTIANKNISGWQHTVFGGTGIKLPTGSTLDFSNVNELRYPAMKPGTGTWDFLVNANYTIQKNNYGINLDPSVTINTTAASGYKFGNRYSIGAAAFYKINAGKFLFTPQAGFRYEYAHQDYYNYAQKWQNPYSGGGIIFSSVGLQIAYRSLGLRLVANLPVVQHIAGGTITTNHKTEAGFFIVF